MEWILSGLALFLVAAIISINHKNRQLRELEEQKDYDEVRIKELEKNCRELNDDLQTVSVLACNTENKNTHLQCEIDFKDRKIEALTGEDLEEDDLIDELNSEPQSQREYQQELSKEFTYDNFEKYYKRWKQQRLTKEIVTIYNTVKKGNK